MKIGRSLQQTQRDSRDSDSDCDSDVGNINKALILIVSGISPD